MYVYTSDGLRTIGLMTGSKELIEHLFKGSKGRIRQVGPRRTHRGTRGGTGRRTSCRPIAIRVVERTERKRKRADRRSRGSRCLITVCTSGIAITEDQTPNLAFDQNFQLAIYVFNICSLAKAFAFEQLQADMAGYLINLVLLSETHLKRHHGANMFRIPGFQLYRRDRSGRIRGGVAIYAREGMNVEICPPREDDTKFENLWLRVKDNSNITYFGMLYHPPLSAHL